MPIKTPGIKEQTETANCLSSIDDKIEQLQQQQQYYKTFKQGLLQQIFV